MSPASHRAARAGTRQSGSSFKAVQIGFFVLMGALVAGGLWTVVQQRPQAHGIPDEIAGYRLLRSVRGPQALQMVTRLHLGSPQVSDAWIAYYEGGGVIWAAITASPAAAQEQVEAMAQAIGNGGTSFSSPSEIRLAGRRAFTVS